jgi:3-deoxy-manno-octulosonate cytidylyltransferase (CMP-KDO synthetase)
METLIVIPARVGSTRLPGKMLADVCGLPLIVHTYKNTAKANVGDVIVACDDQKIVDVIENAGGRAVLTDSSLPSGTDRVYSAWKKIDPEGTKYKYIINVQGDLPLIDSRFIKKASDMVKTSNFDMSTLATPITDESYKLNSVVKPVIAFRSKNEGQALYFSRSPVPLGGTYYHHVGIYCFRAKTLEKFVSLPQSNLEKIEKLEQLRALENGITIGVVTLDLPCPMSVDTQEDLDRVRNAARAM